MNEAGIYIHVPFCAKKCNYCDFVSFDDQNNLVSKYFEKLKKEIQSNMEILKQYNITTIYFGGGTPSNVDEKYIAEILEILPTFNAEEITIEVNPGTINEKKIKEYKKTGFNRISIGLQATDNRILQLIGRIHTYEEFLDSYEIIKKYFKNINVDIMIGLPTQTLADIEKTLKIVTNLAITHISVYSLIVEEGTKISRQIEKKELYLPTEIIERKMYWKVKNQLEKDGFMQYEISNFAKNNYESKHNINCWAQKEYFGFGLAAHSYINNKRYSNTNDIHEYLQNNFTNIREIEEEQNDVIKKNEYMILGLRMINGINIQKFKQEFGCNPIYIYRNELDKLSRLHLIEVDENNIKLTKRGLDLANIVWEEFV